LEYKHGIYGYENPSPTVDAAESAIVQVVVGTAPVNLVKDAPLNVPVKVKNFDEAAQLFGFSEEFDNYTLCASMELSLNVFKIAPLVFINVLDKTKHKEDATDILVDVTNGIATSNVTGILKETVVVKNQAGDTTYARDADYTLGFNTQGKLEVTINSGGTAKDEAKVSLTYSAIDASKVTEADIIGGYDAATNAYTGLELIKQVYPRLSLVPGLVIVPGYSQKSEVARKMEEISRNIHDCFNATVIVDCDPTIHDHTKVGAWKNENGYTEKGAIALWPKIKCNGIAYFYSQFAAAAIQSNDNKNGDVPHQSPSNKKVPMEATILSDGKEIFLEQSQANVLNSAGIVTAVNMSGWRIWGNETCAYPSSEDPKDRYIMTRRIFDFIGNQFVLKFIEKVDDPTNKRLIESVVDSFNMYLNGLASAGMITKGKISFDYTSATYENLLEGKLKFITRLSGNTPAKEIVHTTEFDPSGLIAIGGE